MDIGKVIVVAVVLRAVVNAVVVVSISEYVIAVDLGAVVDFVFMYLFPAFQPSTKHWA